MAAQTWTTLQNTLLVALAQAPAPYNIVPPDFATLFPQATSYAELRICRDIPMLANRSQNTSLVTAAGSRNLNLGSMTGNQIIIPEGLALISPAGQTNPAVGTRIPFDEASLDLIDQVWPQESETMDPAAADWIGRWWALRDNATIVFAPTANATFTAEITGLFLPTPISLANPTTYISTVYPDLLEAACMLFLCGYLEQDFGAASSDPAMSMSFEGMYRTLVQAAKDEELRRRGLRADVPVLASAAPQGR